MTLCCNTFKGFTRTSQVVSEKNSLPILVLVPLKDTRELICYDYPENMLLQPNISNLFSFSHNLKETAHLNS